MNNRIPKILTLIPGESDYELIDKCKDFSFWYNPNAKKRYALLVHDDNGMPYSLTKQAPLFGTYGNKFKEVLTTEIPLNHQKIIEILKERDPTFAMRYEKYKRWHHPRKRKNTRSE